MFPAEDTTHVAEAEDMLIGQYRGLPNITGLIAVVGARAQLVENTFWIVTESQRVSRTFPPGMAQGELSGPPDQALLQVADLVGAPVGTWTTGELALLVQVWILARKSQARAVDILGILLAGFGASSGLGYLESYPAAYRATVLDVPDENVLGALAQALAIARPAGVYGVLAWGAWPTATFYFGDSVSGQKGSGLKDSVSGTNEMHLLSELVS